MQIQDDKDRNPQRVLSRGNSKDQVRSRNKLEQIVVIQDFLIGEIATRMKLDFHEIDPHEPFIRYGLGSLSALSLAGELEEKLQRRLPATLAWDYPTIEKLACYLAEDAHIFEQIERLAKAKK